MAGWLIWVLAGLMLLGAELLLPGAFLLWGGLAALGTGLVAWWAAPGPATATAVFLALLGLGIAAALGLRRRDRAATDPNAHGAGLLGRIGTLLAASGPELRVRIGDSDWPARMAGGAPVPVAGAHVRVEAVEGLVLLIRTEPPRPD